MERGLIWVAAGIVLLAAELLLPGVFLLWVGLAVAVTGVVLLLTPLDAGATAALCLVLLGAGVALSFVRRRGVTPSGLNAPGSGLIGRSGRLLPNQTGGLRIRIGDSDWPARLPAGVALADPEQPLRVEGVEGTTLIVRPE